VPDGVAVCSTVPSVLDELRRMFAATSAACPTVVVGPGVRTGVPLLYDNPREVGPDRIVNTLAAHTLYGGPAVVVDFGTSTNFDVVSAAVSSSAGRSPPASRSPSTRWPPGPPGCSRSSSSSRGR
jgi:type III pantothenate kinase